MLAEKVVLNRARLKNIVNALRRRGDRIVFTNGCFDLIHYGHVKYLEEAKKKGDVLIVGVNSDSSVKRIKGKKRPLTSERERLGVVAALESVNYAVLFNEHTPLALIKAVKPDVLVKGADWKKEAIIGNKFVRSYGGRVETIRFIPGKSTTGLIKKIANVYKA